ncbi:glycosyltransferase [Flavobacterium sp. LM5]|uniref:glycosyltransferase family 2 protein n=1 Tax=Flavobacterium sp. LM5 TaxID=1938610 RepID=UPI001670B52E|nr:glycosyltransferase [Flavobacterium sp. LM5]
MAIVENFNSKRIRLVHNSENKGICFTRQRGVEEAKGKYIAILDADDIAEKNRLQIQYDFLEQNQEFAVCGTNTKFIDENSNPLQDEFIVNTNYDEIKLKLLFANQFINSSVLIRKSAIEEIGGYKRHAAEDYEFYKLAKYWSKVSDFRQFLANLTNKS